MKKLFFICCILFSLNLFAQTQPAFTSGLDRIADYENRKNLLEKSLVANIPFRSAGPTVFSGRVTDFAVSPKDPSHFYVAYASGGLWKTENNGTSFQPLFDDEMVMTLGDIAVNWDKNIIWVGTGENNSSRSSYSGVGMYKSTDGGKTWAHKGLEESHHIGRIVLHPTNPDILWVAVLGHLYSPNPERGVYKTTDGGNTWKKVLFADENSGAIELMIDPADPNVLYAATWHRERRAWNFVEAGNGSGIYKSVDGGENWNLLSTDKSGFPTGEGVGRIGLTMYKKGTKTVLYAILDNYFRRAKEDKKEGEGLTKDELRPMSKADFLKLKDEKIKEYLRGNNFPKKYTVKKIRKMIKKDKIKPLALVEYLEDVNSLLFDTPVKGAEIYRSDDEGKTWKKTHEDYLDNVYNSYGYYFGQIRVSPFNPDKIIFMGVPILISEDGGKTFKDINRENVHVDHHALWLNPNRDKHLILGNDGGVNISYDDGATWVKCNSPAVGQFYAVAVDMDKPYNIYGGLQDNGVWVGSSTYKASYAWHNSGQYPYKAIMGGDGMQIAVDLRDNNIVYTGFQFGNYFRINKKTEQTDYITPKHELGERPLRWNWQAPIHLSVHNQDIFYMGSNKLHRSMNQGDDFEVISEDLTTGGKKGDVAYSTLTSIHESSLKFGLIYTGSDDGLIHVTKDGGSSWNKITKGLPAEMWVTTVLASSHEKSRVYASLNGYRWDDFNKYLYVSEDYGENWKAIGNDLPKEPINVIHEDPKNPNLLYVGTDHGLYISLDRGTSFMQMKEGLPAVSVHDLVVHPRENDLVVGTHGRSIYIANVEHLQAMDEELIKKALHVFALKNVRYSSRWGRSWNNFRPANEYKLKIPVYVNSAGKLKIKVKTEKDLVLKTIEQDCTKGMNYVEYNLSVDKRKVKALEKYLNEIKKKDAKDIKIKEAKNGQYYLGKASYTIEVEKDGKKESQSLKIGK